jgi:hypothetical protein
MTTPVGPHIPPEPPPKDPATVAYGNKLHHTKDMLNDPNIDPAALQAWLDAMMKEGQTVPAWSNSVSGKEFEQSMQSGNIDRQFLTSIITEWLQQQGIPPPQQQGPRGPGGPSPVN